MVQLLNHFATAMVTIQLIEEKGHKTEYKLIVKQTKNKEKIEAYINLEDAQNKFNELATAWK